MRTDSLYPDKLAGLAPQAVEEGDQIVILLGCNFPVTMMNMGSYWTLIGEIYVDQIMYGEAIDGLVSEITLSTVLRFGKQVLPCQ
jgi:hypothetical protein